VSEEEELFERIREAAKQDPVNGVVYQELGADVLGAADIREALAARDLGARRGVVQPRSRAAGPATRLREAPAEHHTL